MAQADWKRYYMIVYDEPWPIPRIYAHADECRGDFEYNRQHWINNATGALRDRKPVGIVRIRGRKNNPELQQWLHERAS